MCKNQKTAGEQKWMSQMRQQSVGMKTAREERKGGEIREDWIEPAFQKHDHAEESVRR